MPIGHAGTVRCAHMPERTVSSTRPFSGKLLSLRVDEVELASGRQATREVVEHPGAVGILAWGGERLAGTLDPGELPRAAAERELAEECGLAAGVWVEGPAFYTAPGFSTEVLTLFMATDLRQVHAESPEDEELERSWVTLPEALAGTDDGTIHDAKSLVGIAWLARRLAAPRE